MQTTTTTTLTAQSIFDDVVKGLAAQGGPARSSDRNGTRCLYRAENGRKCAAGMVILDEEYDPKLEGKSIDRHAERIPRLAAFMAEEGLLHGLQMAHDQACVDDMCSADAKWVEPWVVPTWGNRGNRGIADRLVGVATENSLDPASVYAAFPATEAVAAA